MEIPKKRTIFKLIKFSDRMVTKVKFLSSLFFEAIEIRVCMYRSNIVSFVVFL